MLINECRQDINQTTPETNHSLLDLAIMSGEPTLIHTLITEYEFNVNGPDKYKLTPLEIAATNGQANIVKLLIDQYNADPSIASIYGPPLHVAAQHGQSSVISTLIKDHHVDPNSPTDLIPALEIAAARGYGKTASILIENCANPTIKIIGGEVTPYKLALYNDHSDAADIIMKVAKSFDYTEQQIKEGVTAESKSNQQENTQQSKLETKSPHQHNSSKTEPTSHQIGQQSDSPQASQSPSHNSSTLFPAQPTTSPGIKSPANQNGLKNT